MTKVMKFAENQKMLRLRQITRTLCVFTCCKAAHEGKNAAKLRINNLLHFWHKVCSYRLICD